MYEGIDQCLNTLPYTQMQMHQHDAAMFVCFVHNTLPSAFDSKTIIYAKQTNITQLTKNERFENYGYYAIDEICICTCATDMILNTHHDIEKTG